MATLLNLARQGVLAKLDAGLSWREQEERAVFAFPEVVQWLTEVLPNEASNWLLDQTPEEQVYALLHSFCAGHELTIDRQVKAVRHIRDGIWELKTADVRLFGWFPLRDHFICTAVDTAWKIKEFRLYNGFRDKSVAMRNQLDLDEPKYVSGDDPDSVLSDWCYPHRRAAARFVALVRRELQKAFAESPDVTQSMIADVVGVHRSVINRQLRGTADISLSRVAEIADVLGYEPEFHLERPTPPLGSNATPDALSVGGTTTFTTLARATTAGVVEAPREGIRNATAITRALEPAR